MRRWVKIKVREEKRLEFACQINKRAWTVARCICGGKVRGAMVKQHKENSLSLCDRLSSLAGAEGFEPSIKVLGPTLSGLLTTEEASPKVV